MKRLTSILFLTGLSVYIFAQAAPVFLPDDFDFDSEDIGCVCTPGVINKSPSKGLLLEYTLTTGGDFTPDEVAVGISPSEVRDLHRLRFRLKIPVLLKPKIKMLLGFDHFQEQYHFDFIQPAFSDQLNLVNGKVLKTSRVSFYALQSVNENNYFGIRGRASWNGNFGGIWTSDSYFRQLRLSALWGIKKREDLEWGVGLIYSKNFNRSIVLPFFLYNQTFNERWGIEVGFPVSFLVRYNFNPRSLLLFGPELGSARYALRGEKTGVDDYYFRHTEIQFGAKFERKLMPWVWGSIHTGLQINFDSQYQLVENSDSLFEPDLKTGLFFRVGIFLSPPE